MPADPILETLIQAAATGETLALVTVVKAGGQFAPSLGRRLLVWPDRPPSIDLFPAELSRQLLADIRACLTSRKPQLLRVASGPDLLELFVEVQRRPPTLIIVGAGHVALPLAQLGKLINFEVVVIDDRPQFANAQRFPLADRVVAQPFQAALRDWPIDGDTFIVLVTRGHQHDVACLLQVIDSPARYIGMIGSKRRVRAVFELLQTEQGLDPALLDKVYAPIGLDIGAETPGEIGVAVIAEIINIYRGGRALSLADALRQDRRLPLHPGRGKGASNES